MCRFEPLEVRHIMLAMNLLALFRRGVAHNFKGLVRVQEAHVKELIAHRKDENIPFELFEVTKFLLEENVDLYKSIIILLKKGLFQPCLVLGRIIIENSINLQYIYQKDSETRAKNYMIHAFVGDLKRMKKTHENDPDVDVSGPIIAGIEELKKELQKSGNRDRPWDGKTFKEICEALNHEWVYKAWYSRLSRYVHSEYKAQRSFDIKRPHNDFLKRLISRDIEVLVLETLKSINNKYNLMEGFAVIENYPHEEATLFFSFSSKEVDEEATRKVEDERH